MLSIIGKSKEEAIGTNLQDLMPELKDEPVMEIYRQVLTTGEPFYGNEVPITYKPGKALELHYFNLSYTPLVERRRVLGIIHVAVDVTEQVLDRKKSRRKRAAGTGHY